MADQNVPSASEPVTNIVLVGRTGNGKSSTGNTLLGEKQFISKKQAGGVTMECKMFRAAIQDGPIINVIDTPGWFDLSVSAEYISKEIINCLTMAKEGIHVVLLVLSVRNRISEEEESTLSTLQSIFERKILDFVIVVFTGGDELEADELTLDQYLGESCPEYLKTLLRFCGGRKILLDNKTTDNDKKAKQLKELLDLIADVARQTGGIPYTDNMHRQIKEKVEARNSKEAELEKKKKGLQDSFLSSMSKLQKMVEYKLKENLDKAHGDKESLGLDKAHGDKESLGKANDKKQQIMLRNKLGRMVPAFATNKNCNIL